MLTQYLLIRDYIIFKHHCNYYVIINLHKYLLLYSLYLIFSVTNSYQRCSTSRVWHLSDLHSLPDTASQYNIGGFHSNELTRNKRQIISIQQYAYHIEFILIWQILLMQDTCKYIVISGFNVATFRNYFALFI